MTLNVDVAHHVRRSSKDIYGKNLWKMTAYTKIKAESGGGRINVVDQLLEKRKANKKIIDGSELSFKKLKYNLDLTDRNCEDVEEVCVEFSKGDKPVDDFDMTPEPTRAVLIDCKPIQCPAPPRKLTCFDDKGNEYQDGEEWSPDFCTSCTCHTGLSDCVTEACPELDCVETIPVEGECCGTCLVAEVGSCTYDGETRASGSTWAASDCVDCFCDMGSITCEFFGCTCPVPPENKDCGGYKDGETWYQTNCLKCTCNERDIECVADTCEPLDCTETVQGETDCCPRCKDDPPTEPLPCVQGENSYYHGQVWKLTDCIDCSCSNGFTSCAKTECIPVDECEGGVEPTVKEGECCVVCPEDEQKAIGKPCTRNGKLFPHGDQWDVDRCTTCSCANSEITCAVKECAEPMCFGEIVYDDPEACCPYCKAPPDFCNYKGEQYLEGQTWKPNPCLNCTCTAGMVDCLPEVCQPLTCDAYIQNPDSCCLSCDKDGPPLNITGCNFEGETYVQGERFAKDACVNCKCDMGAVLCTNQPCPRRVECPVELVTPPDQCCPVCPELFCVDPNSNKRIQNGESYKPDPCTTCLCTDSSLSCSLTICPVLEADCEQSHTPEGKCCKVCSTDQKVQLECTAPAGVTYPDKAQWRPNDCDVCSCADGKILCESKECVSVTCRNPLPPAEGECCETCPTNERCVDQFGETHREGDSWKPVERPCETCRCSSGVVSCLLQSCELLECEDQVTADGACCPTCAEEPVGITCEFKGNMYQEGQQFQKGPCTNCFCSEGVISCTEVSCKPLTCTNAILREGKCCKECPAEPCVTKKGIYSHGEEWQEDACTTCTCLGGASTCTSQTCPVLNCTTQDVEGACCPQCTGETPCEFEGKTYVDGQTWTPSNPCKLCQCNSGRTVCSEVQCAPVSCTNPVLRDGECCSSCVEPGFCEVDGQQYTVGQTYNPSPCKTCRCGQDLTVTCDVMACDLAPCDIPVILEGACCPTCNETAKFCTHEGTVYPDGSRFSLEKCSSCVCNTGSISCELKACPTLDCKVAPILKDGDCCPTCPEPGPVCTLKNQTYKEGERWRMMDCTECWCKNSKIRCADIACMEVLECDNPMKVEGKCCLECAEPAPVPGCKSDSGLAYQDGARWYSDCSFCSCMDTIVSCVTPICPRLTCDNQATPEGECCPICIDDSQACEVAGVMFNHRDYIRINECIDCLCIDNAISCHNYVCPVSECDNAEKVPDECCPQCPGDPGFPLPKGRACELSGDRSYPDGSFFEPNDCTFCKCEDRSTVCFQKPCEAKMCDEQGEVQLDGECCTTCRSDVKQCVVDGTTYSHDERFRVGDCKECFCKNGVVLCSDLICPVSNCTEPIKVEGTCCGTCPGAPIGEACEVEGMAYANGQQWRKNKCTVCSCDEGMVRCTADQCPQLDCEYPIAVKGECCRVCPEDAKSCEIDGKTYKNGKRFRAKGCLECICDNGVKTCNQKNCPVAKCRAGSPLTVEGECCEQCPGEVGRSCEMNGLKYSNGQQWAQDDCTVCKCKQGQVECDFKACPRVECTEPILLEGECCQKCPEDLKSCDVDGEMKPAGQIWRSGDAESCERCTCKKGETSCVVEDCPTPACEEPLVSEDGCCTTCPEKPFCMFRGYEFAQGQTWKKDDCTTCQCVDGATICDPEICSEPECTEFVMIEGECCPLCQEDTMPCMDGETEYEHGTSWKASDCSYCSCDNSNIECSLQTCPLITCDNPIQEPGQCCEKCPGAPKTCDTPKGVRNSGETWKDGVCETCTCVDGESKCQEENCPILTCANSRKVEGECCRKCPTDTLPCLVSGISYKHKEEWKSSPCIFCSCANGTVDCVEHTCPEPECNEPMVITDPETNEEQCCPVCPGVVPGPVCKQNDKTYSNKEEWRVDDCTTCTCNDSIVKCSSESCPVAECTEGKAVKQEGKCCKVCPEDAKPCVVNNKTQDHLTRWADGDCRTCFCDNGRTSCDVQDCPVLECENPITQEGKCCPQCPDVRPTRDCMYKNTHYPHSYRWNPDKCQTCLCHDGTVRCKAVKCPELLCTGDEVSVDGECCPVCEEDTKPCVEKSGTEYQHGEQWSVSDCERCTCLDGDITCDTRVCPEPTCTDTIPVEGDCCDTCAGEPAETKAPCMHKSREYVDGEWWELDDCKVCTCEDGVTVCKFKVCPRLTCEGDPVDVEGECCPVCPSDAEACTFNNTMYEHGSTWAASKCSDCTCNDDTVSCDHTVCPELTCEETEDVGQCCEQCKGDQPLDTCTYMGRTYKHGWFFRTSNCKKCVCNDGDWGCKTKLCPELACEDPVTVEGSCCMECPENTQPCEVDGEVYEHGVKWSENICIDCQCDNSQLTCEAQSCPALDCSDPVRVEGECCLTCEGVLPFKACRSGHDKFKNGAFWHPDECTMCTCADGDIHCQREECPRTKCDNPVLVEGECCEKCPEDMAPCQLDGSSDERAHLETWRVSDCETCECNNGNVACNTQACPAVSCEEPVVPENQCCGVCPDPETSFVVEPKACNVKGQVYQHGERWEKDECKYCMCNNGRVDCESPPCDALDCADPIKVDGECCLRCPEDAQPCITPDDVKHAHGEKWSDGDCKSCKCNNGQTDCNELNCPSPDCSNPITVPGQCCKQCPGDKPFETCMIDGEEFQHGEWYDDGPCKTCQCDNGKMECKTESCPVLSCSDPIKVKGQCCKVCVDEFKQCTGKDGAKRKHTEEWKEGDCTTCVCIDGTTSCEALSCPTLSCPQPIRAGGECCPRCPADPQPKTCRLKSGIEYASGQSWPKGPCRTCICESGSKLCETDTCPELTCDNPEAVGDECCMRCPEDIPTCVVEDGTEYKHGETWQPGDCTTCECLEGTVTCEDKLCPEPACENPVKVDGECCPQCPGVPSPKSCKYARGTKAHGDTWQLSPCKSCSCTNGRVDCDAEICPTLTCTDKVRIEGECCRKCIEDAKDCASTTPEGDPYKSGESWTNPDDACETCICLDGSEICTTSSCPATDCEDPIAVETECCPRCPGDPEPKACQYQGAEVPHGELWVVNPCKSCKCEFGKVNCFTESCSTLTCSNKVKVPGQCCRICVDEPDEGCSVDGRQMQTGESFRKSSCSKCTCFFGSLDCDMTLCPELECEDQVKDHDECCPSCANVPKALGCTYQDTTYVSGESWQKGPCKTCSCEDGKINCDNMACPEVTCSNPKRTRDECCMKCPDEDFQSCTVESTGETYDHETSWKKSDCVTCSCDNAAVTCTKELCPPQECEEPIFVEGECCSTCPGDTKVKACTTSDGEKMRHGQSWQRSPCKVCTCDDGNIRCDKETCPKPDCKKPLRREPDECCRKCPPDVDAACTAEDGTVYMPRDTWSPEPCTSCECTELGGVQCSTEECPMLECTSPLTAVEVEGVCCERCGDPSARLPLIHCSANRKDGDTWKPQPCVTCTCTQGEITCESETCPSLDCEDVTKKADECCPKCKADVLKKCKDSEGKSRKQDEVWRPKDNNCEECSCDSGMTMCSPIECTADTTCNNPRTEAGNCCPVCPGEEVTGCVMSTGQKLNHGETIKTDDCVTCTCNNGNSDCQVETCPVVDCERLQKVEGQCCKTCKLKPGEGDCHFNSTTYKSGDTFEDPADACLLCQCAMSEIACGKPGVCPAVDCPSPYLEEGGCCPVCPDVAICNYENKLYQSGEFWKPTDCESCECVNGEVLCLVSDCAPVPCDLDLVTIPGKCCPQCPTDFRQCMQKDRMYNHGETWTQPTDICVECFCDDSAICCEHLKCPEPECHNPLTPPGECCARCNLELRECALNNGGIYQHGDTWDDDCSTCECVDGEEVCAPVGCPALFCENPIKDPRQCCPRCPASCFHRNAEHQSGETWEDPVQRCISCTCNNGFVSCGPTDCSQLLCLDPVQTPGSCCGTCPDISFGRTRLELYGTTNNYGLNLNVDVQNVERNIEGTEIWRVKLWSATRSNGGGAKTQIIKQALNEEQASQMIGVHDTTLRFEALEYVRDLGNLPCNAYPYVCAEFYMTRAGYDIYSTSVAFGDEISTICLEAC